MSTRREAESEDEQARPQRVTSTLKLFGKTPDGWDLNVYVAFVVS